MIKIENDNLNENDDDIYKKLKNPINLPCIENNTLGITNTNGDSLINGKDKILNTFDDISIRSTKFNDFGGRIRISSLLEYSDSDVILNRPIRVGGWIRTTRLMRKEQILFAELNDGSCVKHLQIIIAKNIPNFDELSNEGIGACVIVRGSLVKSKGSKQKIELNISRDSPEHYIRILGKCDISNYKLVKSKDKIKLARLREVVHSRPRTNIIGCVSRIRSNLALASHHFFQSLDFLYINTPIITQTDFESINLADKNYNTNDSFDCNSKYFCNSNIDEQFSVTTLLGDISKDIQLDTEDEKINIINDKEVYFTKDFFKSAVYSEVDH